ncbi:MAG: ABC transporter ATP-binding protein [Rhodobacteraceae bacterium]|nr:ABC transporter ATP-binding protein [Paracoccaceae bacterium]MCY4197412.1 ABC transporter ATP-binding protein [Paracoccaceae bacterium]MCY4328010.1 ABC transporter ATP-binding protein [Paracoccaceae bacterium]
MSVTAGLSVTSLSKSFKDLQVLDKVTFDVPKSETLVLFGPSGAGKTVLLRCIAGAVDADSGTVQIDGDDVTQVPPESRGVGMAFQNFALFPHMNAFENIASPLRAQRQPRLSLAETVDSVARLLKIDHVLDHAPRELSNGQKQRTALARALAAEPGLLLLDDPLRNVDAKLRFEMRLELPRLLADRQATVVYVTQDYKEAMALGDRIAVLDQGRIVQIGSAAAIYRRPANITIAKLFGDPVINLLEVVPEREKQAISVQVSNQQIMLPHAADDVIGRPCMLGIRPEDIAITAPDVPAAVPVSIEAETPLNEKIVSLAITQRGRELLASRPADVASPSAGAAGFLFNGDGVMLFDRESERRIDMQSDSGKKTA